LVQALIAGADHDAGDFRERSFGSFERTFPEPDGVDLDKIDASFKKGVVTVTLPKTGEAQKAEKKIDVKPG
jgi:HSP20 family protein